MLLENEQKLFKAFPLFYQKGLTYGFECNDGWFELIWEMSEKFENLISEYKKQNPDKPTPYCFQVKEKFGQLRMYPSTADQNFSDLHFDQMISLEREALEKSSYICEICGEKGVTRTDLSWIKTLCNKHYQERKEPDE